MSPKTTINSPISSKRINVPKFQGVYYRDSSKRRHLGKPDRCFDICYRDSRGKLIWEKVGWVSEGYNAIAASQIRSERIRSIRHGEDLPKKKSKEVTLGEVWVKYDEWIENAISGKATDRSNYKNHIEPLFANTLLSKIDVLDLERLKSKIINQGLAPATAKHILVLIRQLINKAILWGMWKGENPVKKVKLPKLNNSRERFLSYEEAHILLRELEKVSPQLTNISLLSLHTGMRAGEIFKLKWSHLDMGNNLIHVADPKNIRPRKAFMTTTIKEMFENMETGKPEGYVFESRKGSKIQLVSHAFDRTVTRLSNSCYFWVEEFKNGISPDQLRKVIKNEYPDLPVTSEENSLIWLNNLLELPSFYDIILKKHRKRRFSDDIKTLILTTAKYRSKDEKTPDDTEKENIQKLNRLLVETIYPDETPKMKSRFNNGVTDRRQKITFHTLRHTFASWLAMQGTPCSVTSFPILSIMVFVLPLPGTAMTAAIPFTNMAAACCSVFKPDNMIHLHSLFNE